MSSRAFPMLQANNRSVVLIVAVVSLVFALFVAYGVSIASYKRSLLAVLLFVHFLTAMRNWRLSVYLFVGYVLVEGFIINYFSGQRELHLLKDVQLVILFLLLCAGTLARHNWPFPRMAWMYAFFGFAGFYVLTAFNPALPSFMIGLVGVRVTLVLSLCVAVAFWFFRSNADVMRFLKYHAILSLPISAFGIVQYFTGPSLLLSISPGFGRAIYYAIAPDLRVADLKFRAISTFASTGGFSQYLWVAMMLTWAYYLTAHTRRERWLAMVALVLQLGGMLASGGRAPLILAVVTLFFGYALMRRFTRGLFAGFLAAGFIVGVITLAGGPLAARFGVILDIDAAMERNSALMIDQLRDSMQAPVEGIGAGQLTAAATNFGRDPNSLGVENQFARIRYESGLPGLMLFLIAIGMMAMTAARLALLMREPSRRMICGMVAGYFLTVVLIMPVGMPLDVPPANFYFWFLFGMLHAMARTEDQQIAAARQAQAQAS